MRQKDVHLNKRNACTFKLCCLCSLCSFPINHSIVALLFVQAVK